MDVEDDVQPLVLSMLADALRAMRLLAGLVADTKIDKERLRSLVSDKPITVTELADTLVREEGLSFRLAHRLVPQAVGKAAGAYSHRLIVAELKRLAPKVIRRQLKIDDHDCLKALDPTYFVKVRTIDGGPAPIQVQSALRRAPEAASSKQVWLRRKQHLLHLHPDTNTVAIITGNSSTDAYYLAAVHAELIRRHPEVKEIDLVGLPTGRLLETVSALPHHTIVLFQEGQRDSIQPPMEAYDILAWVGQHLPTYCIFPSDRR